MNSDAQNTAISEHPSSLSELGRRFSAVLDRFKTRQEAARVADRSTDQLGKYAKGMTEPPFQPLMRLCAAAGVRAEWLAFNTGDMLVSGQAPELSKTATQSHSQPVRPNNATLDRELLDKAFEMVGQALTKRGIRHLVDPDDIWRLARIVHDDLAHGRAEDAASAGLESILNIARSSSSKSMEQG